MRDDDADRRSMIAIALGVGALLLLVAAIVAPSTAFAHSRMTTTFMGTATLLGGVFAIIAIVGAVRSSQARAIVIALVSAILALCALPIAVVILLFQLWAQNR